MPVTLVSRGEPVAGILVDLAFMPQARIAATARGHADCRVDPTIGKDASAFVFQPIGCDPARTCTAVRGLIISAARHRPDRRRRDAVHLPGRNQRARAPGRLSVERAARRRLVAGRPAGAPSAFVKAP